METKTRNFVWGLGSAAAVIVGAIGPWAAFGPFSASGTSGDGQITLVLGLVALALIYFDRAMVGVFVIGVVVTLIGIADTISVSSIDDEIVSPSAGWGVILTAAAGISLLTWSATATVRKRRVGSVGRSPVVQAPEVAVPLVEESRPLGPYGR
jgi:hypothetical protein